MCSTRCCRRLSTYLEKAQALKHRVQMAIVYPILVMTIAVLVVAFLMIFIIPIFAGFFEQCRRAPPAAHPHRHRDEQRGGAVLVHRPRRLGGRDVRLPVRGTGPQAGRLAVDRFFLRAPIFGPLVRKISIARFTRTLSALLGGGVPIIDALRITAKTAGNRVMENSIMAARGRRHGRADPRRAPQGQRRLPAHGGPDGLGRRADRAPWTTCWRRSPTTTRTRSTSPSRA